MPAEFKYVFGMLFLGIDYYFYFCCIQCIAVEFFLRCYVFSIKRVYAVAILSVPLS